MEMIANPYFQLCIYAAALLSILILTKLKQEAVIMQGVNVLLAWLVLAAAYGVPTNIPWAYYLALAFSIIIGYALLWGGTYIAERFGRPYSGDGALYLMVPIPISAFVMALMAAAKLIWSWIV